MRFEPALFFIGGTAIFVATAHALGWRRRRTRGLLLAWLGTALALAALCAVLAALDVVGMRPLSRSLVTALLATLTCMFTVQALADINLPIGLQVFFGAACFAIVIPIVEIFTTFF